MKKFKLDFIEHNIRYEITFDLDDSKYDAEDFSDKMTNFFSKIKAKTFYYNEYFIIFLKKYKFNVENLEYKATATIYERLSWSYLNKEEYLWHKKAYSIPIFNDYELELEKLQLLQEYATDVDYYFSIFSIIYHWEDLGENLFDIYHQIVKRIKHGEEYKYYIAFQEMGWCGDFSEGGTTFRYTEVTTPLTVEKKEDLKTITNLEHSNITDGFSYNVEEDDDEEDIDEYIRNIINKNPDKTTHIVFMESILPMEVPFTNINLMKDFSYGFKLLNKIENIKTLEDISEVTSWHKNYNIILVEDNDNNITEAYIDKRED
jgi:hypothetical protein